MEYLTGPGDHQRKGSVPPEQSGGTVRVEVTGARPKGDTGQCLGRTGGPEEAEGNVAVGVQAQAMFV